MLLSDDHRAVQEAVRAYVHDRIAPHAAQWDRDAYFPREALRGLAELGCYGEADAFRAFMEIISMLALPGDIMARPGFSEHLAKAAASREPFEMPGPSRADLLSSLA